MLLACKVHNPDLLARTQDASGSLRGDAGEADGGAPDATADGDVVARCGDGTLDDGERCDTAIAEGQEGACPSACPSGDPCAPQRLMGIGCQVKCQSQPITSPTNGDGCCPPRANSTVDDDCPTVCGNDVIEDGETCDPPDSCPEAEACTSSNACLTATYSGDASKCTARCDRGVIESCADGDGCCPGNCDRSSDDDCSISCGDGIIDEGESCEADSDTPCPTQCDDGDSCTSDTLSGSAANCNARCTHTPITQAENGDGCCPDGAHALNDDDCDPVCGNNVMEPTEDCEDGNTVAFDGCSPDCQVETQQTICTGKAMEAGRPDNECTRCICNACPTTALNCYAAANSEDREVCLQIVECAASVPCSGAACYCGTVDLTTCTSSDMADGPCRDSWEQATGGTNGQEVFAHPVLTDLAAPLGTCRDDNCAAECGL